MNDRYALINKMTVKPGKQDEAIAILPESGKSFDDNPSGFLYLVYKDKNDSNVIWVEDVWTNKDDHTAAMSTPETQTYISQSACRCWRECQNR